MNRFFEQLNLVPSAAWVLIGSLLTAIIAFVGVALTNRASARRLQLQLEHEKESKRQELLRSRIEELYLLTERWTTFLVSDKLPYIKVMRGELTYNQALDMTITHGAEKALQFERIAAIVDLYFPDLKGDLDLLFTARDEAGEIERQFRERYRLGDTDGPDFVQPMQLALRQIDERSNALQARVVEIARKL